MKKKRCKQRQEEWEEDKMEIQFRNYLKINSILIFLMLGAMILEKLLTVSISSSQAILIFFLVENAKLFKEDLLRRNVKNSNTLNLQSLRLGINSIIALSNAL